ncbi:putative signal peptide protein [Puccinia sorghi]|uniref:Putative signal peptide protein n=1 Tax=Puccinia sorghi TaxID=27349 RepID=A0A0L6VB46_9BASI|nr:putative signal peptide protein [Puccinia sorghi]
MMANATGSAKILFTRLCILTCLLFCLYAYLPASRSTHTDTCDEYGGPLFHLICNVMQSSLLSLKYLLPIIHCGVVFVSTISNSYYSLCSSLLQLNKFGSCSLFLSFLYMHNSLPHAFFVSVCGLPPLVAHIVSVITCRSCPGQVLCTNYTLPSQLVTFLVCSRSRIDGKSTIESDLLLLICRLLLSICGHLQLCGVDEAILLPFFVSFPYECDLVLTRLQAPKLRRGLMKATLHLICYSAMLVHDYVVPTNRAAGVRSGREDMEQALLRQSELRKLVQHFSGFLPPQKLIHLDTYFIAYVIYSSIQIIRPLQRQHINHPKLNLNEINGPQDQSIVTGQQVTSTNLPGSSQPTLELRIEKRNNLKPS